MKKIRICVLLFLCILLVSCEHDLTKAVQQQFLFDDVPVVVTLGRFLDECRITYKDEAYVLSDFSKPEYADLTVQIEKERVSRSFADISLSSPQTDTEMFLYLHRLLQFLQTQQYHYRDAEHQEDLCFTFSFEGKTAKVTVDKNGNLKSIHSEWLLMKIQEGND